MRALIVAFLLLSSPVQAETILNTDDVRAWQNSRFMAWEFEAVCVAAAAVMMNPTAATPEQHLYAHDCGFFFAGLNSALALWGSNPAIPYAECYPKGGMTTLDLVRTFLAFMEAHPEAGDMHATSAVLSAIEWKFPCAEGRMSRR
jgi:hypothetical protein